MIFSSSNFVKIIISPLICSGNIRDKNSEKYRTNFLTKQIYQSEQQQACFRQAAQRLESPAAAPNYIPPTEKREFKK